MMVALWSSVALSLVGQAAGPDLVAEPSTYPIEFSGRPFTLPQGVIGAGLASGWDGGSASLQASAAAGITDDLELRLGVGNRGEVAACCGVLELVQATYRITTGGFQLALWGAWGTGASYVQRSLARGAVGLAVAARLTSGLRLDSGVGLGLGGELPLLVPLRLFWSPMEAWRLGIEGEVAVANGLSGALLATYGISSTYSFALGPSSLLELGVEGALRSRTSDFRAQLGGDEHEVRALARVAAIVPLF